MHAKKIKITTLFNNSSPLRKRSAFLESIRWTQTVYAVLCQPHHTNNICHLHPADILQNGATLTQRRRIVEKSRYFILKRGFECLCFKYDTVGQVLYDKYPQTTRSKGSVKVVSMEFSKMQVDIITTKYVLEWQGGKRGCYFYKKLFTKHEVNVQWLTFLLPWQKQFHKPGQTINKQRLYIF